MHQRPVEGLPQKDNMTVPPGEEGSREKTSRQALKEKKRLEGDRGGNERVSRENLTRAYHLQYIVD